MNVSFFRPFFRLGRTLCLESCTWTSSSEKRHSSDGSTWNELTSLQGCRYHRSNCIDCGVSDVEDRLARAIPQLERAIPGYRDFIRFSSPKTHVEKLKCPVFLFHAQDDANVPVSQTTTFAELLKKTNPDVTVDTSARGGHYEAMINAGIPKGIAWMKRR